MTPLRERVPRPIGRVELAFQILGGTAAADLPVAAIYRQRCPSALNTRRRSYLNMSCHGVRHVDLIGQRVARLGLEALSVIARKMRLLAALEFGRLTLTCELQRIRLLHELWHFLRLFTAVVVVNRLAVHLLHEYYVIIKIRQNYL